jgi:GNAT superfamily N-acetyltransferase
VNLQVFPLSPEDRDAWQPLAEGYKAFYRTPTSASEYDQAWAKLMAGSEVSGLGAGVNGRLVGMAHYLFHASTWAPKVCYLQDLYTSEEARGVGVARALIQEVASRARKAGASRCYWLTQESNAVARVLYEKVAKYNGFIRYDFPLRSDA